MLIACSIVGIFIYITAADGILHKNRPVLWELNLFATIFIVYGPRGLIEARGGDT